MKVLRRILAVICILVLLVAGVRIGMVLHEYNAAKSLYRGYADSYVTLRTDTASDADGGSADEASSADSSTAAQTDVEEAEPAEPLPVPPIEVDFDELLARNPDVVGWIYCEDTVINYPVLQGDDNTYYLHHTIDGTYNASASIFADGNNRRDFQDANTILYGHHMKNGSMFAGLDEWADQDYYEAHSVMWLLTPTQNYEVVLFAGYTTKTMSDSYTLFTEPGEELDAYIERALSLSDFTASDVDLEGAEKCVMLSTCAYVFNNARYVLHGVLLPAET